jgi:hypothetical protein
MEPDYRAMLLAVVARSEQLIVQMDAILREASDADTAARVSMQLAKQWRLLADVEQKLKQSRQTRGLKRHRRHRSTRAATGSHHGPGRTTRACPKGKTRGEYVSPPSNSLMSVVAWHHGASRSIAYWTIRHEPSGFVFARCANRKDAVALAEKVYGIFPVEFWQTTNADAIEAMLQPYLHTILEPPIGRRGGDCGQKGAASDARANE